MKQGQTSTSNSPSVIDSPNYLSRAVFKGALKPALLAVVAAIVTAGCKTQAITPPGGAGMPMPPSSGGMPAPGGGSSGSSGGSSGSSGGSSGSSGGSSGSSGGSSGSSGGSSGSSGGSSGGMPAPGGGSSGSSGGSSGSSGGSSGSVGSVPQIEMPGGFPGADGGADGDADGDSDGDGDSNSDCGDTGTLPGGVGGMGQAGECLGGGGGSASDSEAASDSSGGGDGSGSGGAVTGTGGAGGAGQFPAESDAERAERLGRELEESVGGFDQVLMEEQREIASVGRSTEGFGGGGSGSGGGSGGISLGEQSAGGSSGGSVSIANPSSPTRESPIAGMSDQEIRERTPDDIPVTVDDDIISRQLREAALAEEDPELRERLWVEYRKYRGL